MDEELRTVAMAFALHTSRAIVQADGKTEHAEFRLLGTVFPRAMLRDAGLIDEHGDETAAYATALNRVPELRELPEAQRLDLVALLHAAAVADDHLDRREWNVLVVACEQIGLTAADLLDRIRLDEP